MSGSNRASRTSSDAGLRPEEPYRDRWPVAIAVAFALACIPLSFAVYWPRLEDYFVYDDFFWLRAVRNHSFWTVMLRAFTFPSAKPFDEVTLFWRPLVDLYFYVAQVVGLRPGPYHVVNVFVHGAVGGLGVIFIWRLTRSIIGAALSGVFFTIAPTYDFAVTWISQASELFAAALVLCALLAYERYLTSNETRRLYVVATALLMLLALLAKESALILLLLLPALAWSTPLEQRRRSPPEIVKSLIPVIALASAFLVVMLAREFIERGEAYGLGWHMVRNLRDYLEWMAFPYPSDLTDVIGTVGALLFLAAASAAVLRGQRRLVFLALWTILALLPFTGFRFGIELRYTYLATLPFVGFFATGMVTVVRALPRPAALVMGSTLMVAVVLALVVTPMRTRDQQGFLAREAAAYEAMVTSVRTLCGELPPGSRVFVEGGPYRDLYYKHTRSALNLYYVDIDAARVDSVPELAALIEDKCVIQYDPALARYVRTQ